MHRIALLLLLVCASALGAEPGAPAADFALPDEKGRVVTLADQRGKILYLDFWASWCVPCRQSFPWLNDMQARYASRGLQIVGVGLDEKRQDADRFLASYPARFTIAFDATGATPRAYGVKGMPSSYLIGRDGRVIFRHIGFRPSDKAELERRIARALERGAR